MLKARLNQSLGLANTKKKVYNSIIGAVIQSECECPRQLDNSILVKKETEDGDEADDIKVYWI